MLIEYIESNALVNFWFILLNKELQSWATPLNNTQIENTEWLPLHQVIANCQFPQPCLDAYWSSSWAAGAIYFQQIQQETGWVNEHLETNGMGGEVEKLLNSSNLINRLQPFF